MVGVFARHFLWRIMEIRLMGTEEEIEHFYTDLLLPKYTELWNENKVQMKGNNSKLYSNRGSKEIKRRYINLEWHE